MPVQVWRASSCGSTAPHEAHDGQQDKDPTTNSLEGTVVMLTDLPAPLLEAIAALLDTPSKKAFRAAIRATQLATDMTIQSMHLTQHNTAAVLAAAHRFSDLQRVAVILQGTSGPGPKGLVPWLNTLTSMHTCEVTLYVRDLAGLASGSGADSHLSWLSALSNTTLASLSVAVHVEHAIGPAHADSMLLHRSLSRALCSALGQQQGMNHLVALTASPAGFSPSELRLLPDLACISKLCGIRLEMNDSSVLPLIRQLTNLVHLHLTCCYAMDDRGASTHAEEQCEAGLGAALVTSGSHLTHLTVAEFMGNTAALLQDLSQLPHLVHLALPGLGWHHGPITATHLHTLTSYPSLTSLGVDRLRVPEETPLVPNILSLEVGLSVTGSLRLPNVFPNVKHAQLRWLWEGALLKIAGWTDLRTLGLSQLGYGADWRLLRTLPELEVLNLAHGTGSALLQTLLTTAAQLPNLRCLAIMHWDVPTRTSARHSGTFGAVGAWQAVGAQLQASPSRTSSDACVPASQAAAAQGDGSDELARCLGLVTGLQRLELVATTAEVLKAVRLCALTVPLPWPQLHELRLAQLPDYDIACLLELVGLLPTLNRLELGACGAHGDKCFRDALLARGVTDRVHVVWDEHEDAAFGALEALPG